MDPNPWNTYNLQYGHSTSGGLTPTHSSINRLDLTSGLGLGHSLQASHGSLGSRPMGTLPSVNYGLSMPFLDTVQLTSGISAQQSHKAMSLGQSSLVFDPQVRVTAEQQSPTFGRFDGSKSLRADGMTRNQLLEAARMWGSTTSLHNQFGPILTDVSGPTMASLSSSPSPGSGGNISSKANQLQMHDPPPAHSSNTTRLLQRNPHSSDLIYGRSQESLIPSSLSPISLYSSSVPSKQSLASSQQQSLHRQTPVQIQQSYSSQGDIEDLSSNSQNQLYGSYANLSVSDSQDFSAQLSGDISYEAVSPAAPISENSQVNQEHTSFSMVQFPDLANLTSEHAHTLADKFQENDFRLKMDSSRVHQHQQDMLLSPHSGQRQDMGSPLKIPKDMSNLHLLSMQMNQRGGSQYQPGLIMGQSMSIAQNQGATMNINHPAGLGQVSQHSSMTTSSMQQSPAPIPIQALADSTTKPKRSRNRKKKDTNPPQPGSPVGDIGKKSSPQAPAQMSHHSAHILNMPPTSPHISTLSLSSHGNQSNQLQQQQQIYRNSASNQYTSRDAQRAQTPSMPQNYSLQDHQNHGYPPAPSPKMPTTPNQNLMRSQNEFVLPGRLVNDKSSSSSYKQQQRKPAEAGPKSSNCPGNQVYRSNIPENQQHMQQSYGGHPGMMAGSGQQRGSPMQDGRLSRMQSFAEQSPHQKMSSQMSPLGQPSPQGNDNGSYNNGKMGSAGHMMGSGHMIGSQSIGMSHSPMDSRPVSVEPSGLSHGYDHGHPPGLIDTQDPGQFHLDFSGPPFLEQLVGSPPPMAVPSTNYGHSTGENGEVVFTTLVTPAESARIQQQQHDSSNDSSFRPTYHGEAVHEIRPMPIGSSLAMEEVSFNAFFDHQRDMDHDGSLGMHQQNDPHPQGTPESEKMSLTFVPHVIEDDELSHFSQPGIFQSVIMGKKEHPDDSAPKPPSKDSFQDSFLNYLQGHKQETLSSVSSSAVTKKPQLPKYIPEPRRPKPAPAPKENSNFSDTDDGLGGKMRDFSDNDSSHKSESDKEGYSVQRTSELAVKITLPKSKKRSRFGPFAESSLLKDSMRRNREGMLKRKRRKSKHRGELEGEDLWPGNGSEDETPRRHLEVREPTPPPVRTSIGRKAKEKCIEKTKKHVFDSIVTEQPPGAESSTEEETVPFKSKGFKSDDSDKNYDSDKDPVWMPFEVDLKQGHEFDEKRKKARRPRMRMTSTKSSKSSSHRASHSGLPPAYTSVAGTPMMVHPHKPGSPSVVPETSNVDSEFKVGTYVIEKKDLQNCESYPIWRLEQGNMIRKFEIKIEDGKIQHVAVGTFSTWMRSMESQFELIQVREVMAKNKSDPITVEVLEEYRPKLPSDGRLEMQYEDDPLVEPFNVYLQVFLSQALEPNFLSVILQTSEKFYVDALNQIDHMIENKCEEITRQAHWKASFLECLHRCPLMKEIDRPNLKQPCQASENSSPPTIKSVLLSGQPYDRFLLVEQPTIGLDVAQEFMIGKVAAYYVRTYHSLYHFKYWLRQRCDAKVKMMKESNKNENLSDEVILEKCLENTSWVLQLFDNLKNLLKYGGEAPR